MTLPVDVWSRNEASSETDSRIATPLEILLFSDDPGSCAAIADLLHGEDVSVHIVRDSGFETIGRISDTCDLVLIDLIFPPKDGFDLLREIRSESDIPIILLTARTGPQHNINGLNTGADDCLPKPFWPEELMARIRAVLRRTIRGLDRDLVRVGDIVLTARSRTATQSGRLVPLTSFEFDLLSILMRRAGKIVSREEIAKLLYSRNRAPFDRAIDIHISHLRKKIEADRRTRIRTVRGKGYLFTLPNK